MAFWLCQTCRDVGIIPYDLLVTLVWLGELDPHDIWTRSVALYLVGSTAQFESDVAHFSERMDRNLEELINGNGDGFGCDYE